MGHLINPISLRIGKFSEWTDNWFSRFIYYPEYFHVLLKIKLFLIYFLNLKLFERLGFIFSNFLLVKHYKFLYIRCFFYNGNLDQIVDEFFYNIDTIY